MRSPDPQRKISPFRGPACYTFILLWLVPFSLTSQITFERMYGGINDDIGRCVRQTVNNGYILCGYTKSFGAEDYDAYVILTDELGDTLWTRLLGGPGFDAVYSLAISPDNGFLLCGTYFQPGKATSDIWLIRLNPNGDTLWTNHSYSTTNAAAYSVHLTPANGFIVTGTREDAGGTGHMFLMETDESGNQLWCRDYPYWATSGGNAVIPTSDSGFLICGYIDTYNPSWNRNLGMLKTNIQGDTLWTRQFGGSSYEMGWTACEGVSGGYLAAGYTTGFGMTTGDGYVVKTTDQGIMEWQTHFGNTGLDIIYDISRTSDLNYIGTGISAEQGSEFQEAWLFKLNPSGDTLWSRSYGGYGKSYGYSAMQTSDEGFVFCGNTNNSGSDVYDILLVKTTSEGVVTSLKEIPGKQHLPIFPNPARDAVTIELPDRTEQLMLTTLSGKIVVNESVSSGRKTTMNLRGLASGLYLLKIVIPPQIIVERLIIR